MTIEWSEIAGQWADETIKAFPYQSVSEYCDRSILLQNVIIDPQKIVGSDPPDYASTANID